MVVDTAQKPAERVVLFRGGSCPNEEASGGPTIAAPVAQSETGMSAQRGPGCGESAGRDGQDLGIGERRNSRPSCPSNASTGRKADRHKSGVAKKAGRPPPYGAQVNPPASPLGHLPRCHSSVLCGSARPPRWPRPPAAPAAIAIPPSDHHVERHSIKWNGNATVRTVSGIGGGDRRTRRLPKEQPGYPPHREDDFDNALAV